LLVFFHLSSFFHRIYSILFFSFATSRARCVALVVASPALIRVACRNPRQMQLANALCRFVEVAAGGGFAPGDRTDVASALAPRGTEAVLAGVQLSWLGEPS